MSLQGIPGIVNDQNVRGLCNFHHSSCASKYLQRLTVQRAVARMLIPLVWRMSTDFNIPTMRRQFVSAIFRSIRLQFAADSKLSKMRC
jgi:hypothetical protein